MGVSRPAPTDGFGSRTPAQARSARLIRPQVPQSNMRLCRETPLRPSPQIPMVRCTLPSGLQIRSGASRRAAPSRNLPLPLQMLSHMASRQITVRCGLRKRALQKSASSRNGTGVYTQAGVNEPLEIASASDGTMWYSDGAGNKIDSITTSGTIKQYSLATAGGYPWGLTAGPATGPLAGYVYFTEFYGGKFGRIDLGTLPGHVRGHIDEYPITLLNGASYPQDVAVSPDGQSLWFTNWVDTHIVKVTFPAGAYTEDDRIDTGHMYGIGVTSDPVRNLIWFHEQPRQHYRQRRSGKRQRREDLCRAVPYVGAQRGGRRCRTVHDRSRLRSRLSESDYWRAIRALAYCRISSRDQ